MACDAERFIDGLRQLAVDCNLEAVDRNSFGIIKFYFKDGSTVGGLRAYENAGIINLRYD